MINHFIGEFLFHPSALELSMNKCTHDCIYCFANIRKNCRVVKLKSIINQINKDKIKNYDDALINAGFSICMSNRVDPFSLSNYKTSLALGLELNKLKNPLFIQTKGGNGIDEFINTNHNKKVFYITITTLNENIRKRIEPNAPTTEERLLLCEKLKELGYLVIVAVNPIYEEWMKEKDLFVLMERLKKIGIKHICTEALHLNKREVLSFSEKRKNSFRGNEIVYSSEKKSFQDYVKKIIPIIINNGFHVMKLGMPYKTDFFNDIRAELGKIFPNHYDIINYCHNEYKTHIVTFDEYYNKTVDDKKFFEREFKAINKYILRANIKEWALNENAKQIFSLKGVLNFIWNNPKIKSSISRNQSFRIITDNLYKPIKDEKGNLILYFDKGIYPTERIININNCRDEKI